MQQALDKEKNENGGIISQNVHGWFRYWDSCANFSLGNYNNYSKLKGLVTEVGNEVMGNSVNNWIKIGRNFFSEGSDTIIYSKYSNSIIERATFDYNYAKLIKRGTNVTIIYDIPKGYTKDDVRTLAIIINN